MPYAQAELAAEFCNWLRTLPLLERLVRPGRRRLLPPVRDASRKTLILDMDNTLIKATHLSPTKSAMVRPPAHLMHRMLACWST